MDAPHVNLYFNPIEMNSTIDLLFSFFCVQFKFRTQFFASIFSFFSSTLHTHTPSIRVSTNNRFLCVGAMNCNSFCFSLFVGSLFLFNTFLNFLPFCFLFLFGVLMRLFSSIPSSAYSFAFLRSLQLWCNFQFRRAILQTHNRT